jgi:penicillin V acylase-like amidase (Ntn superfamily)
MNRMKKILGFALSAAILLPICAHPCTTFCLKNGRSFVFGRNYDWDYENAVILVNKRNIAKKAFLLPGVENPAQWASKYGSITFNQYGREFPLGGMNEAGLVIEMLWLAQAEYPLTDPRPAVIDSQWVQYQLDTAATVADVLASDQKIRIDASSKSLLHFLVCDSQGGVAVIELLGGRLRTYTGKDLPVAALANNTYAYCLNLLDLCNGDETHPAFAQANNSLKRFMRAANGVRQWNAHVSGSPVPYAFQVLEKAAVDRTMFRIVYEGASGMIYFRTKSTPDIRHIDIHHVDFSCRTPVQYLDILEPLKGDVTANFKPFSWEANYRLIKDSVANTSLLKMSDDQLLKIAKYPEDLICRQK